MRATRAVGLRLKHWVQQQPPVIWIILAISLAGRITIAWSIPFYPDELYELLAAKMILLKGAAVFPSGTLWPMGGPLVYLQAPLVGIFGFVEGATRLPTVILSTVGIYLLYRWGKDLFGRHAAAIAAFAMAVDPDAVVWGAYARPYSVSPLMVLLTLLLLRRASARTARRQAGLWAALAMVITVWMLPLIILWLPAFFAAYVIWSRRVLWGRIMVIGAASGVGTALVVAGMYLGDPGLFKSSTMSGGMLSGSVVKAVFQRDLPYFSEYLHRGVLAVIIVVCGIGWLAAMVRRRTASGPGTRDIAAISVFGCLAIVGLGLAKYCGTQTLLGLLPLFYLLGGVALMRLAEGLRHLAAKAGRKRTGQGSGASDSGLQCPNAPNGVSQRRLLQPPVLAGATMVVLLLLGAPEAYWNLYHKPSLGITQCYRYVKAHWQHGDVMLNANPLVYIFVNPDAKSYYLVQRRFGLGLKRTRRGYVDRVLGAPLVKSTGKLKGILDENPRVWYVVKNRKFRKRLSWGSRQLIRARMKPVFTYGRSTVYSTCPPPRLEQAAGSS